MFEVLFKYYRIVLVNHNICLIPPRSQNFRTCVSCCAGHVPKFLEIFVCRWWPTRSGGHSLFTVECIVPHWRLRTQFLLLTKVYSELYASPMEAVICDTCTYGLCGCGIFVYFHLWVCDRCLCWNISWLYIFKESCIGPQWRLCCSRESNRPVTELVYWGKWLWQSLALL